MTDSRDRRAGPARSGCARPATRSARRRPATTGGTAAARPPQRPAPVPHRDRPQPRALSAAEQQAILDVLHSDRFVDLAPAEVWATLLDEGVYLGSDVDVLPAAAPSRRERASGAARPPTRRR